MHSEPLAYNVNDACRALGIGRTKLFELIKSGAVDGRRAGGRLLIPAESLRSFLASLPKAA
jgi:excisionase family DNA binding protein